MKRTLKILAIVAMLPTPAFAAIGTSKHNLASTTTNTIRATNTDQVCVFCHTPHAAQATQLLWNHTASTVATYSWGTTATTAGTSLPTTQAGFSALTLRCLSCHDGTVGLGSVSNPPNTAPTGITMTQNLITSPATRIGFNGSMAGHHPLAIPYAGATYNAIASKAVVGTNDYWGVATAGCNTPTGACTLAPNTAPTNGTVISLFTIGGALPTTTNVGIECASCHDVHNEFGNTAFLRVNNAGSGLCLSCHRK